MKTSPRQMLVVHLTSLEKDLREPGAINPDGLVRAVSGGGRQAGRRARTTLPVESHCVGKPTLPIYVSLCKNTDQTTDR